MRFSTKICIITGLFASLLLQGCGDDKKAIGNMPVVSFIETTVTPTTLTAELSGRTSAYQIAEIRPQVSGIIQARLFTEGAYVEKDTVLYQIDPALFEAAVNSAEAALMQAEATAYSANMLASRYQKLVKSNAVSKQEYDDAVAAAKQAQANVAAAKAQLDTAQINLGYTKVTAPIAGIIGKSAVTAGALVAAGQAIPLAQIQQLSPMYVDVTQSSTEFLRLKKLAQDQNLNRQQVSGTPAALFLPDGTQFDETGTILFSEVSVDPSTGSYLIRAEFPNAQAQLMQNQFVRLRISAAKSEHAVLVPQRVVFRDIKGVPMIRVLEPKTFAQAKDKPKLASPEMDIYTVITKPVTIAQELNNQWVITEGLSGNEKVLMEGGIKLLPGMDTVIAVPYTEPQPTK